LRTIGAELPCFGSVGANGLNEDRWAGRASVVEVEVGCDHAERAGEDGGSLESSTGRTTGVSDDIVRLLFVAREAIR
jgi:hypothetical protein